MDVYLQERDYARRFEGKLRDCQEVLGETARRFESLRSRYIAVVAAEDGIMPLLDQSLEEAFRLQKAVAQFSGLGLKRVHNAADRKFVQSFVQALAESGGKVRHVMRCLTRTLTFRRHPNPNPKFPNCKVHQGIKDVLMWCHHNAEPELDPLPLPEYLKERPPKLAWEKEYEAPNKVPLLC